MRMRGGFMPGAFLQIEAEGVVRPGDDLGQRSRIAMKTPGMGVRFPSPFGRRSEASRALCAKG